MRIIFAIILSLFFFGCASIDGHYGRQSGYEYTANQCFSIYKSVVPEITIAKYFYVPKDVYMARAKEEAEDERKHVPPESMEDFNRFIDQFMYDLSRMYDAEDNGKTIASECIQKHMGGKGPL